MPARPASRWRRPGCFISLALLILLALWLGWTGWQVVGHVRRLQANVAQLQALAAPGALDKVQPADLVALQPQIAALDDDVQGLARRVRPFVFITPALGWLPKVGPEAAQARKTASAGRSPPTKPCPSTSRSREVLHVIVASPP